MGWVTGTLGVGQGELQIVVEYGLDHVLVVGEAEIVAIGQLNRLGRYP